MAPEELKVVVSEAIEPLREDVKLIKHLLTGNGAPEKGVLMRMDRLEQIEKSRAKAVWAAITAAIGALVVAALSILKV